MTGSILAICVDSGDTLIDEATEIRNEADIVMTADLIPGAGQMMRALKERGYRLALVADGYAQSFRNILGQHGLFDLFEVHAISSEVGVSKPHADMFRCALDGLGIAPADYGRVIMLGNHLGRDVKGANELGLISVWLDWSPRRAKIPADASEQPRYTIKEPLALLTLLDEIEKEGIGDRGLGIGD
jgi:putative hydrolase of the HAD superfamily